MSRNNPYVSRGPVRIPEMFFGRQHELNEIAAFLNGNQSMSIIGPRKIGKTSLLFHLLRPDTWPNIGLDDTNLFTYLDCEVLGECTHEEIFGQFAQEMLATLSAFDLPPEPALEAAVAKPTRLSFESAVRKLNQRGLRIILILDEFERLSANTNLNVNFFNALRSMAGRYQLVFITASARPLIELTQTGPSQEILSSPFFNIFAPLFLGLLSEDEAFELIDDPAAEAGIEFPAETQDFIYELAGGHPLALQVTCFHAFDLSNDLDAIKQRATRELASHFQYYWNNLSAVEQESLCQLSRAMTRAIDDTTQRAALRDLVQKCLLVADGQLFRYSSQAWADFVAVQTAQLRTTSTIPVAGGVMTGVIFGPYEVQELIGRGGMAEVYKGFHRRLDRPVAIKILNATMAEESDFRRRFEREARAVAGLRHPNIVQIYDFGDMEGVYYMVMEYIAGHPLSHYMREVGPMTLSEAHPLLADIASALDYAHSQELIHRDVKPSNVMLQPDSGDREVYAVLTDFGIAKLLKRQTGITHTEGLTGTLDYIAPEQIRASGDIDHRADIYALGVMTYQMLTGQLPYKGDNAGALIIAHMQQPIPDARYQNPSISKRTALAIMRAMAKDASERFGSASEFVSELVS